LLGFPFFRSWSNCNDLWHVLGTVKIVAPSESRIRAILAFFSSFFRLLLPLFCTCVVMYDLLPPLGSNFTLLSFGVLVGGLYVAGAPTPLPTRMILRLVTLLRWWPRLFIRSLFSQEF